jgi:hypothetical protein
MALLLVSHEQLPLICRAFFCLASVCVTRSAPFMKGNLAVVIWEAFPAALAQPIERVPNR